MQFNAVLSNREHPEYGVFTESFPVSRASYDDNIEMIRQLEIGVAVAQDCHVDEITGDWPVLRLMEHTQVNFDELDYLAQRLDSFDQYEKAQFQGMAAKLELHDVRELINLTFCCQDATVITDFSELDIAGRRHYMTLNGGGASPDELKKLDARAFAEELIDYNIGYKPRSVPLLNKTVEHCNRYLQMFHPEPHPDDYLFYTVIHGTRHQMSADCVARFMKKYGDIAREDCLEMPPRIHPHQLRHTRAIHYYRDGMPLVLVAEQLGHASTETTKIYAYADTEMKRAAMEKADSNRNLSPSAAPIWQDNDEMILKLSGLK